MQSVVTSQAPVTLDRKITSGDIIAVYEHIRMINMAQMLPTYTKPGDARKNEEYFGSSRWRAQH